MSDLAALGLLDAPHLSAGRAPTHVGLRLFVDGMMQYERKYEKREFDSVEAIERTGPEWMALMPAVARQLRDDGDL